MTAGELSAKITRQNELVDGWPFKFGKDYHHEYGKPLDLEEDSIYFG